MKWPESVPVLTAKDICRGLMTGPNETHCLLGWAFIVFRDNATQTRAVFPAIDSACGTPSMEIFNDNPRNSKAKVAAAWNRAMRNLGYTEIFEVDA